VNVSLSSPLPSAAVPNWVLLSQSSLLAGCALHMVTVTSPLGVNPWPVIATSWPSLSPWHGLTVTVADPLIYGADEQRPPAACAGLPEPTRTAPETSAATAPSRRALRAR
jgi:hypothetical protein